MKAVGPYAPVGTVGGHETQICQPMRGQNAFPQRVGSIVGAVLDTRTMVDVDVCIVR